MPCLVGLLALAFPRLAVVLVWFFNTGYFSRAFGSALLPLLGFIFLPLTTLTFAYAHNTLGAGQVTPLGWLLTLIALLIDIGLVGGGHSSYRRRRRLRA